MREHPRKGTSSPSTLQKSGFWAQIPYTNVIFFTLGRPLSLHLERRLGALLEAVCSKEVQPKDSEKPKKSQHKIETEPSKTAADIREQKPHTSCLNNFQTINDV